MPGFILILECVNKRICNMLMRHVFNKYVPKLVCLFSKYTYSLEHLPFVVANIFILFVIFSEHFPGEQQIFFCTSFGGLFLCSTNDAINIFVLLFVFLTGLCLCFPGFWHANAHWIFGAGISALECGRK